LTTYWNDWHRGTFQLDPFGQRAIRSWPSSHRISRPPHRLATMRAKLIGSFDRLVRQLSVGAHLFATLAADPSALHTLLQLVTRAPRLAPMIAQRPMCSMR